MLGIDTKESSRDKNRCRLILKDKIGKRYKLTVLSSRDGNISKISKIISFSDEQKYTNMAVHPGPVPEGEDVELEFKDATIESSLPSDSISTDSNFPSNSDMENKN